MTVENPATASALRPIRPPRLLEPARLAGQSALRCQSDDRLVELARAGNERAFEAIVHRYRRPLVRYSSRLLREPRAEDAVQQTFLNAYRALSRGDGEIELRPWLYRIAHNASVDAMRRTPVAHEELDEQIDGVERPEEAVERGERVRSVLRAVQELPERQRDAILLRELEGRSYEEIANELEIGTAGVRQLLNRARNSLRAVASAITPPFLLRLPSEAGPQSTAARVAELSAGVGGAATLTKVAATVLVGGSLVGGGVVGASGARLPFESGDRGSAAEAPGAPGPSQAGRETGGGRGQAGAPAGDAARADGPATTGAAGASGRREGRARGRRERGASTAGIYELRRGSASGRGRNGRGGAEGAGPGGPPVVRGGRDAGGAPYRGGSDRGRTGGRSHTAGGRQAGGLGGGATGPRPLRPNGRGGPATPPSGRQAIPG